MSPIEAHLYCVISRAKSLAKGENVTVDDSITYNFYRIFHTFSSYHISSFFLFLYCMYCWHHFAFPGWNLWIKPSSASTKTLTNEKRMRVMHRRVYIITTFKLSLKLNFQYFYCRSITYKWLLSSYVSLKWMLSYHFV